MLVMPGFFEDSNHLILGWRKWRGYQAMDMQAA
jgi:hypothetical protein